MSKKSFIVNWKMNNPIKPKDSFFWKKKDFRENDLDELCNWPKGTTDTIHEALKLNLSRSTEWIYENSPELGMASKIYKRGIYSKDNPTLSSSGKYPVIMYADDQLISTSIEKYDCLVIDYNFYRHWNHLFDYTKKPKLVIELSEAKKNIQYFAKIHSFLNTTKSKFIGIFGGGIVSDVAAFAAASQEIRFDLIPTTTLSMIDACIGGKTGVNAFPYGKNLIGMFAFPDNVHIYKRFLSTLGKREFRAGIFEGIKHCILSGNKNLFISLVNSIDSLDIDQNSLYEVIKVKSSIIEKDANESSIRATLNLGHTFGHAIEAYANQSNIQILHGEAVLFGIIFAIKLSKLKLNLKEFDLEKTIISLTSDPDLEPIKSFVCNIKIDDIYEMISNDKKNDNISDTTNWILMKDWGDVLEENNSHLCQITKNEIESCLVEFKKSLL